MTKTYGAINPQQIISLFEMRAKIADTQANAAHQQRSAAQWKTEAATWTAAADILANTEFVGWTEGKRVGELAPADVTLAEAIEAAIATPETASVEPSRVYLTIDAARMILAALERPQAIESAAKYMLPRENHAQALASIREASKQAV